MILLGRGSLFVPVRKKDIPGDADSDEAGKGNSKKNILVNVKELHGCSLPMLSFHLPTFLLLLSKPGARTVEMFKYINTF